MFAKAGELQRQLPEIRALDADYIFNRIELFKRGYSDDLLKRWTPEELGDALPAPVFLIGFLRSGTTLTEQVLAAHPQVLTSDENHLLEELSAELAALAGAGEDTPAALRRIGIDQPGNCAPTIGGGWPKSSGRRPCANVSSTRWR